MAQYLGSVQGQRGEASRLGSKSSGLETKTNGWHSGVKVRAFYNQETERDEFMIWITGGSNGYKSSIYIGKGYADGNGDLCFQPVEVPALSDVQ